MQSAQLQRSVCRLWHPNSWKNFETVQQPQYENLNLLEQCLFNLKNTSNLVSEEEIRATKYYLEEASKGNVFILQAGDCAETFSDCNYENVSLRIKHLQDLQNNLNSFIKKPVIIIGRIAGQYAKPRSELHETINKMTLPCFRGDIINSFEFTSEARKADPLRLIKAFECSKATYNWIHEYINSSISYNRNTFFSSHEALHLDYETALTRMSSKTGKWYNYGTHFLWLGERTKHLNGAHVEYLRGISNPIGIKVGPNTSGNELLSLIRILNPEQKNGRITLITRLGSEHVTQILPTLIQKINKSNFPVIWSCDPMHGNGQKTQNGIKTRYFEKIWKELSDTIEVHKKFGSNLSGAHFEVTPMNVTECVGGKSHISEELLKDNYLSYCDPRLNGEQSLEIIQSLGELMSSPR